MDASLLCGDKKFQELTELNDLSQDYGNGTISTFLGFMFQRKVQKTVGSFSYRSPGMSQRSPWSPRIYFSNDSGLFALHLDGLPLRGLTSAVQ